MGAWGAWGGEHGSTGAWGGEHGSMGAWGGEHGSMGRVTVACCVAAPAPIATVAVLPSVTRDGVAPPIAASRLPSGAVPSAMEMARVAAARVVEREVVTTVEAA